jgi:hypothetical protein
MPEIKKDLDYFLDEEAKKEVDITFAGSRRFESFKDFKSKVRGIEVLQLKEQAKDRFHAYELSQLKEQLAQKDKEIFDLTYSRDTYKDLYHERKETIERLTKELLDYEDFNECEGCGNENDSNNRYCKHCM